MRKFILLVVSTIILFGTAGCGKNQEAADKPIKIAVEFTTHSACAHIANQKGWYREEGLIVTFDRKKAKSLGRPLQRLVMERIPVTLFLAACGLLPCRCPRGR